MWFYRWNIQWCNETTGPAQVTVLKSSKECHFNIHWFTHNNSCNFWVLAIDFGHILHIVSLILKAVQSTYYILSFPLLDVWCFPRPLNWKVVCLPSSTSPLPFCSPCVPELAIDWPPMPVFPSTLGPVAQNSSKWKGPRRYDYPSWHPP